MNEEKGLAVLDNRTALAQAVGRYNLLVEFTKTVMKANKDFGIIPGTDKPTLLKPGAEKLNSLFQYSPDYTSLTEQVDFDKGFFYLRYKCDLYDATGRKVGSGIGSCNSQEKKYRYRNVFEWKATDEEKATALRVETKEGKKGKYKVYVIENPNPADLLNTIDKMAQKRALIAATLIACNASEFFTQDIEDMDIIEGEYVEAPTQTTTANPIPVEHDAAIPTMSIETAMNVMTSETEPRTYGALTDDELKGRVIGIQKALRKNGKTQEEIDDLKYKLSAATTILNERAKGK